MTDERKITRALVSVTDKRGLGDLIPGLHELGVTLIASGGTATAIRLIGGFSVIEVADVTGFPEMLGGRVKTLHPAIAAGILARRDDPTHMAPLAEHGISPIDMVVVNLYDFAQAAGKTGITVAELIEQIDIGGPTLIRAAAKNFADVAVVVDPGDYAYILREMEASRGTLSLATRFRLAQKAFALTAAYERAIESRLSRISCRDGEFVHAMADILPPTLELRLPLKQALRYGENPHQRAALYAASNYGIANAQVLGGKALSYNNLVDADAAWQLACEFSRPACAIIKHTNPCGCAEADTPLEAYLKALECDPVSAFGSVIAFSWATTVDEPTATELSQLFVEVVIASEYTPEALAVLRAKKNLRILQVVLGGSDLAVRSISGGMLVQTPDVLLDSEVDDATLVTKREPTAEEWRAMRFAGRVVKHVKSNAIVFARDGQLLGVGAGQMNRVNSVRIAAQFARLSLTGCVCASDAFFTFPDGVEAAIAAGATAIVQPGGSKNDALAIAAANVGNVAMVFTGARHFRH